MSSAQPSGVDLARVALQAARAATRQRPRDSQAVRRPVRRDRGTGRDPVGLGTAITGLIADHAWEMPTAGGTVIERWPEILPELHEQIAAVRFDPATGQLDVRPCSAAYSTHARLIARQLVRRANAVVGDEAVCAIRVLAPGAPVPSGAGPRLTADRMGLTHDPAEGRAVTSEEYQRARAALQEARRESAEARSLFGAAAGRSSDTEASDARRQRPESRVHALALRRARTEKQQRRTAGAVREAVR